MYNKLNKYIEKDKDKYGKIYANISFAISDISSFLNNETLQHRKYVNMITTLKKYIELLETTETTNNKKKIFNFFNQDNYITELDQFKIQNFEKIVQLEQCFKCSCLTCTNQCSFNSCQGCKNNSYIAFCDHKKINVTLHNNFSICLKNNNTGITEEYKVIATLEDCELDQMYIIFTEKNSNEKYVLYYSPGISEDTYEEITDGNEFDYIVQTFEAAFAL